MELGLVWGPELLSLGAGTEAGFGAQAQTVYEGKPRAASADILGLGLELGLGPGIWAKADLGLLLGVFELGTVGKVGPPPTYPTVSGGSGIG